MTLQSALIKKIEILKKQSGIYGKNNEQFAKFCKVPVSTMKNILNGNTGDIKSSTVWKIACACGLTMEEFYSDPVFNNLSMPK